MAPVAVLPAPPPAAPVAAAAGDARLSAGMPAAASNLRRRSVRGGFVTLGAQGGRFVLQLGSTAVLARLLTPHDYGLVGMVTVVTGFVSLFKDLGLSMATIQRRELTHEQVNALFWINVAASAALMVITASLAPVIAWVYGEPQLVPITLALAGTFLFGGLAAQHTALLKRSMRFTAVAAVDVVSMAVGIAVGVFMAWRGFGYWSLVGLNAATQATHAALPWVLSGWMPSRPARAAGVGEMLAFGGHLTGFNTVNYLCRNADNFLIGWQWGAGPLGLYGKAYNLLLMPIQQINRPIATVAMPVLCRLQDDPERYRRYYLAGIQVIVTLSMPLVVSTFVLAEPLVLTLLGPGWGEAANIYRVLAAAAFVDTINVAPGWAFVSRGETDRQLKWQLFESSMTVVGFIVGLRWGPIGVAAGFSTVRCLLRYPVLVYCLRNAPLKVRDLMFELWRPATAAVGSGVALAALARYQPPLPAPQQLVLGLGAYGALYLAAWCVLPGGVARLREMASMLRELRPARAPLASAGADAGGPATDAG